jgi:hypothetical protein
VETARPISGAGMYLKDAVQRPDTEKMISAPAFDYGCAVEGTGLCDQWDGSRGRVGFRVKVMRQLYESRQSWHTRPRRRTSSLSDETR